MIGIISIAPTVNVVMVIIASGSDFTAKAICALALCVIVYGSDIARAIREQQ